RFLGNGDQRSDFKFVADGMEALLRAAYSDADNCHVFNLGHYEHISLKELAKLLMELNSGGKYELVPFPGDRKAIDIGDYYADFRKIDKLLGWSPQVTLEGGLKQTLEFYRANQAHYWD